MLRADFNEVTCGYACSPVLMLFCLDLIHLRQLTLFFVFLIVISFELIGCCIAKLKVLSCGRAVSAFHDNRLHSNDFDADATISLDRVLVFTSNVLHLLDSQLKPGSNELSLVPTMSVSSWYEVFSSYVS